MLKGPFEFNLTQKPITKLKSNGIVMLMLATIGMYVLLKVLTEFLAQPQTKTPQQLDLN